MNYFMETHPALALIRFGLGRRGDEALPADPEAWLLAQLDGSGSPNYPPGIAGVADGLAAMRQLRALRKVSKTKIDFKDDPVAQQVKADVAAECAQWLSAEDSFRERLVIFWSNHFTVSRRTGGCAALIGPFIREAIRPNVNGNFGTMLLAVMRHPAMLIYLNNAQSFGPDSDAGLRRHQGLNENLGRECLELHTLSPAAGYTQTDVTSMASILTGWSVKPTDPNAGFLFRPVAHEPGPKILMGHQFPEGEEGGIEALAFLANHPATARHIATKLARHFVADDPPPALVDEITDRYIATGGNLPELMRVIIDSADAWQGLTKLRTPVDFVCAGGRAVILNDNQTSRVGFVLNGLGQPVWNAPSPKGWSDLASDWIDPATLLRRVEYAYQLGGVARDQDPVELTNIALGPYAAPPLKTAVASAGSRQEAIALLFSSPAFWRR